MTPRSLAALALPGQAAVFAARRLIERVRRALPHAPVEGSTGGSDGAAANDPSGAAPSAAPRRRHDCAATASLSRSEIRFIVANLSSDAVPVVERVLCERMAVR